MGHMGHDGVPGHEGLGTGASRDTASTADVVYA